MNITARNAQNPEKDWRIGRKRIHSIIRLVGGDARNYLTRPPNGFQHEEPSNKHASLNNENLACVLLLTTKRFIRLTLFPRTPHVLHHHPALA